MADDLLRFNDLEQVIYTPLAENTQLQALAWQVIEEAVALFESIMKTCRHESETAHSSAVEKTQKYYDEHKRNIMTVDFADSAHTIETVRIVTEDGAIVMTPAYPPEAVGATLSDYETLTVYDTRKGKTFRTIQVERVGNASRIASHEFRIIFKGEETTVRYNAYGVLTPSLCGIVSVLGLMETVRAEKLANKLNEKLRAQ